MLIESHRKDKLYLLKCTTTEIMPQLPSNQTEAKTAFGGGENPKWKNQKMENI